MLILTRRVGETIMIGEDVAITVLRVKGNQIRLGVSAPKDVSVQREEIFERMRSHEGGLGLAYPSSSDEQPLQARVAGEFGD